MWKENWFEVVCGKEALANVNSVGSWELLKIHFHVMKLNKFVGLNCMLNVLFEAIIQTVEKRKIQALM